MTSNTLKNYEKRLFGGYEPNVLHIMRADEDGEEVVVDIVMFMMDAEYDPVRLTFGYDGEVSIHADEYKYHAFTAGQLLFIAEKSAEARSIWAAPPSEDE